MTASTLSPAAAFGIGDQVVVRDPRQCTAQYGTAPAPINPALIEWAWFVSFNDWFIFDVTGVAATIKRSPLSTITVVTPLSNLRRTEAAR